MLIGFLVECGSLVFVSCGIIMGMVAAGLSLFLFFTMSAVFCQVVLNFVVIFGGGFDFWCGLWY